MSIQEDNGKGDATEYSVTDGHRTSLEDERFPERLMEAIGARSTRSFARDSGVSETVLRAYLAGKSEPTRPALVAMARAAHVRTEWLATGEGPMSGHETGQERHQGQRQSAATPYGARVIDEELLGNMIERLEELIEESGEVWTPQEKAELIARAYKEEIEEEALPDKQRRVIKLIRSGS